MILETLDVFMDKYPNKGKIPCIVIKLEKAHKENEGFFHQSRK